MSVINTNLMYIIQSELINTKPFGHSEFLGGVSNHQSVAFDDRYAFIKKVLNYDDDVKKIVNLKFFGSITLENEEHDNYFKRAWINRFLNDCPKFQTLELFANKVAHVTHVNYVFLTEYYANIADYMQGLTSNKGDTITDNRVADATLPQTEVNIDVEDTILQYADANNISKNKVRQDNDARSFNIDNFLKARNALNIVFDEYDAKCFLQVW